MTMLLINHIKWDCDGSDPAELGLPTTILVVNAHNFEDDDEDILSDQLSDVYGFCHEGYLIEKISGDSVGQRNKLDQKIDAIMEYPVQ